MKKKRKAGKIKAFQPGWKEPIIAALFFSVFGVLIMTGAYFLEGGGRQKNELGPGLNVYNFAKTYRQVARNNRTRIEITMGSCYRDCYFFIEGGSVLKLVPTTGSKNFGSTSLRKAVLRSGADSNLRLFIKDAAILIQTLNLGSSRKDRDRILRETVDQAERKHGEAFEAKLGNVTYTATSSGINQMVLSAKTY